MAFFHMRWCYCTKIMNAFYCCLNISLRGANKFVRSHHCLHPSICFAQMILFAFDILILYCVYCWDQFKMTQINGMWKYCVYPSFPIFCLLAPIQLQKQLHQRCWKTAFSNRLTASLELSICLGKFEYRR